jgi:hypothetical protein
MLMMRFRISACLVGLVSALSAQAQPPDGPPRGGPPRFELGRLLPPHARAEAELTKEQEKQLADLEKEVKERLRKIFTADQLKKLDNLRPPRPGGPVGRPEPRPQQPQPEPEKKPEAKSEKTSSAPTAIQWFSSLDAGLREAQRTGQPILLVSAAPHCAGVSGIW